MDNSGNKEIQAQKEKEVLSDEDRLKLVLELLKEEQPAKSICSKYQISIEQANIWKDQFLERSSLCFQKDPPVIAVWKTSLRKLLTIYENFSRENKLFFPMLFLFFVIINISCYWLGAATAFPELIHGNDKLYYFKIQFPVGFLGALFDSLSFYITIYIIKRALKSSSTASYVGHLSIDLLIAMVATAWVLFVFWFSGWIISFTGTEPPQQLAQRTATYEHLIVEVLKNPLAGWRNIYFGIIMGFSTMIPTFIHFFMFLKSVLNKDKKLNY